MNKVLEVILMIVLELMLDMPVILAVLCIVYIGMNPDVIKDVMIAAAN